MYCTIIIPTATMKKVLDKMQPRQVKGGDFKIGDVQVIG